MSNAVIEVVLGLVFVFFLFSMLCSGINEFIANVLGKRSDFLAGGVWRLLDNRDPEDGGTDQKRDEARKRLYEKFWRHPLIQQLGQATPEKKTGILRTIWGRFCRIPRRLLTTRHLRAVLPPEADPRHCYPGLRPSYISPHTFALVLRDILPDEGPPAASPLGKSLLAVGDEAGTNRKEQNAAVARWYDAQMERVSGWYKRESKLILILIAAPVVVGFNVDTVSIARDLWTNPTLRTAVADAAERQIEAAATSTVPPAGGQSAAPAPPIPCPTAETGTTEGTTTTSSTTSTVPPTPAQVVERALECARSLSLPIGWRWPGDGATVFDALGAAWPGGWVLKLFGWALTIGALTFGAPFWFDLLNRLGSLRSSGARPKSSADTD